MISLQTNVDSLIAQRNLGIDNQFQSNTIQQLTSGYRINKSGDDAAGLAIANGYSSQVAELTQGVSNGNAGVSQLQIVDGGLSNISTILNRLKTLATESASSTFTGDRGTLNQEYSGLISEINRQANNINMNAGGTFNSVLNVFIGGGGQGGGGATANSQVSIDLSGNQNAVDASSLGLSTTNVLAGGVSLGSNLKRLDAPGASFLTSATETFSFNVFANGSSQTINASVGAGAGGISGTDALTKLNGQLNQYGINASLNNSGLLQFSGATAFNVASAGGGATALVTGGSTAASNTSNYIVNGASFSAPSSVSDVLTFEAGGKTVNVTLGTGDTATSAIAKINAQTASVGVFAVLNSAGTGIDFQSSNGFAVNEFGSGGGTLVPSVFAATGSQTITAPSVGGASTTNATSAITAIDSAIKTLGLVQGSVGAGENKLQYSISLAQSQISSFSAAESQIKDADVAAQAANLTKAQVLTQTSIAALAQANSEPQSVLKLLQG